jgi:hypothetical protein
MAEGHSLAAASAASRRQNLSFWLNFFFYRPRYANACNCRNYNSISATPPPVLPVFITLRSGIVNFPHNKPSPIAAADVHAITMQLWQPHGGSAFPGDGSVGAPAASGAM